MSDTDSPIEQQIKLISDRIEIIEQSISELQNEKCILVEEKNDLVNKKRLAKSINLSSKNWESEHFEWSDRLKHIRNKIFRLQEFRPKQLAVMNALLDGNDVLFVAPTGGGKSLCYQLPALVSDGITIVISPLISLMKDQVWNLVKLGIKAELLTSTTDRQHTNQVIKDLSIPGSSLKLLYVTPERMAKSKKFMNNLQKCHQIGRLDRFAVDEVHCCSQWGHDYRPDYKYLGTLKVLFPKVPILGVTATATSKVILDVQKMLSIQDCIIHKAPFNRPNLYYHILEKPQDKESVLDLLAGLLKKRFKNQSGIIYTFSIKDAEDITQGLLYRDCKVRPYHATLPEDKRHAIHTKWLDNQIQAVVATVAFGMGIDKPDVRFVIHHTVSKSMENFYQESGRAGRDGKRAECIVLYRFADIFKITTMVFSEYTGVRNAYGMLEYCINGTRCRRKLISTHFAEVWSDDDCDKMCDRCFYNDRVMPPRRNITPYCLELIKIVNHAEQIDQRLTALKLLDAWFHKGPTNLRRNEIKPPTIDRIYAEQIVAHLLILGYLMEDFHYTAYTTISYIKKGSLKCDGDKELLFYCGRIFPMPTNIPDKENQRNGSTMSTTSTNGRSSSSSKTQRKSRSSTKNSSINETVGEIIEIERKRRRLHIDSDSQDDDEVILLNDKPDVIEIED